MKGVVEVIFLDETIAEESNMLLYGFGEQIVTMLTMPRFIATSVYSAIMDTSNYTIQAISFGKDSAGYNRHAHSEVFATEAIAGDGILRVYNRVNTSSYDTSNIGFNILPEYPYPTATRLESNSTNTSSVSNSINLGHNPNIRKYSNSNINNIIGCYPPASGLTVYILTSLSNFNSPKASFTLSGNNFNKEGTMDSSGLVKRTTSSIEHGRNLIDSNIYSGLMFSYSDGWDTSGAYNMKCIVAVSADDVMSLTCYGGVYNIGLWGIDIKETLARGILPPYNLMDHQNLVFKLLSKKSFTSDITKLRDISPDAGYTLLKNAATASNPGLKIIWNIYFK